MDKTNVQPKKTRYQIEDFFLKKFGKKAEVIVRSPGRINIIGEHTDYNSGFVLPAAIDHHLFVAISKNDYGKINLFAIDYDEEKTVDLDDLGRSDSSWVNLILGVINQVSDQIDGIDLAFGGNTPQGAGLSSSAALCCGVAYGLSQLYNLNLEKWEIARMAQKAEHEYALVYCGIMDQFACLFGLTNHVLLLNCASGEYEKIEIDMTGFRFILINSNVKHALEGSDYNVRKNESNEALSIIKKRFPAVQSYQDVTEMMLRGMAKEMDLILWNRAYHVVTENSRVLETSNALRKRELLLVGKLLNSGHQSLRDYYEITCRETDFLVEQFLSYETVLGARQVGGGFGGCLLVLVKDSNVNEIVEEVAFRYEEAFSIKIDNIPIKISDGCSLI